MQKTRAVGAVIGFTLAAVSYFVAEPLASAAILLAAFTVYINIALASGVVLRDPSWAVLLSGAIYALLSILLGREVSLWASLVVLLAVEAALTHSLYSTSNEAAVAVTVALLAIGVTGAVLGAPLTSWILVSPFIEQLFSQPAKPSNQKLTPSWLGEIFPLYLVSLYILSLHIPPPLALYSLGLTLARSKYGFLVEPEKGVLDSAARLAIALVSKPWIHVS